MRIVWSWHVPAQRRQKRVQGVCAGNNARPGSAVFVQRLFARVVEHWARGVVHGVRSRAVRQRFNRTLVDSALQCVRQRSASGKHRHELLLKAYGLQPRHMAATAASSTRDRICKPCATGQYSGNSNAAMCTYVAQGDTRRRRDKASACANSRAFPARSTPTSAAPIRIVALGVRLASFKTS